ncbi:uncharacterized protein LOC126668474 [Mercurialis annua]|uniref:uncharacterized protein LOC126668474 n=1 Tax=Mercurialis annua TaxID=3986 RepID=UPI002160D089|nr:uncharacterized protein LOC126668474 [Mercurialis annua]
MYSNFAKYQAFPVVFRVSSKPIYCQHFHTPKTHSLPFRFSPNPLLDPKCRDFVKPVKGYNWKMNNIGRGRSISSGFSFRSVARARSFSHRVVVGEGSGANEKSLPWLSNRKEGKELGKRVSAYNGGSSRKNSGRRFEKTVSVSSWEESAKRVENGANRVKNVEKEVGESAPSARKDTIEPALESNRGRNRMVESSKDGVYDYGKRERSFDGVEEGEDELDVPEDPRWDRIKSRFDGMTNARDRTAKPEFNNSRWNKQENWGRKTYREASESSLPRMIGEGVYGVGPVLAALSASRREFYALYVQEGLDLTSNNKKKKDKKGFEKVLRMAQNISLNIKEVSKHDLNMIADNRPHQGLVLDASPLEMVKIMKLDPVSHEDKGSLWVALDEVTDPQNLGAIIRSAYFFGASGIVLCAKNSAPLSGIVSKASAGSLEIMELRYCKNMMQFLVSSAENGWRILGGSVAPKSVPLNEVVPGEPTVLVLGSEGTGLRPLVERSCTQLVKIPGNAPVDVMAGVDDDDIVSEETNLQRSSEEFRSFLAVESLNVSVAAGVLIHHLIGSTPSNNDE